jgi:hypothetical protein
MTGCFGMLHCLRRDVESRDGDRHGMLGGEGQGERSSASIDLDRIDRLDERRRGAIHRRGPALRRDRIRNGQVLMVPMRGRQAAANDTARPRLSTRRLRAAPTRVQQSTLELAHMPTTWLSIYRRTWAAAKRLERESDSIKSTASASPADTLAPLPALERHVPASRSCQGI